MMGGKTVRNCEPALGAAGAGASAGFGARRAAACDGSKDSFIAWRRHKIVSQNSAIGRPPPDESVNGNFPRLVAACHAAIHPPSCERRRGPRDHTTSEEPAAYRPAIVTEFDSTAERRPPRSGRAHTGQARG